MEELNTPEKIAQWVIDKRYPKSEFEKVSDSELYNTISDAIHEVTKNNFDYLQTELRKEYRKLHKFYDDIFDRIMLSDNEAGFHNILKAKELISGFRQHRTSRWAYASFRALW